MKIFLTSAVTLLIAFAILPSLATNLNYNDIKLFEIPKSPAEPSLKKNLLSFFQNSLQDEPPAEKQKRAIKNFDFSAPSLTPVTPSIPKITMEHNDKPQVPYTKSDDEPGLQNVKYIDLYGQKILLPEIYNADNPTLIDTVYGAMKTLFVVDTDPSISDLHGKCNGIEYMSRVYTHLYLEPALPALFGSDTPQSIANKIIKRKQNNIMAIVGEKGSGKTVALTKILNLLRSSEENTWTLFIDASNVVPNPASVHWTAEQIYDNVLDPIVLVLFNEVMNHNPSKINLLIDNTDKLSPEMQVRLADYLQGIHANGVGVVLTANRPVYIVEDLVKSGNVFQIPQLDRLEIEKFMTQYWDNTLISINRQAHVEYAKAVSIVVEKTPLFVSFATMKELAKILVESRDAIRILTNPNEFVSLKEYAEQSVTTSDEARVQSLVEYGKNRISDTQSLIKMLAESKFNKLRLAERLIEPLIEGPRRFYVAAAVETVLSSEQEGSYLDVSSKLIVTDWQYPPNLNLDMLQHLDHANFIFASCIIDDIVRGKNRNRLIAELAKVPKYLGVMEYINSALINNYLQTKFQPVFHAISSAEEHELHSIMDIAISNGHDQIAACLIRAMDSIDKISRYFQNTKKDDHKILESTTKYNLGMLTEADIAIQADRYEMMFRKNMLGTIQELVKFENYGYRLEWKIWRPREFSKYLNDFFLCQSQPNIGIYIIMRNYEKSIRGHSLLRTEDAMKRMHNIIKHADLRSKAIMTDIQHSSHQKEPWKNSIEGEYLVHVALAKLDTSLVQYVIDDLGCKIEDISIPMLMTVLDTNPLPFHSQPKFWKTMYFLIKRGYVEVPRISPPNVNPTPSDLASPAYQLISGADPKTLSEARNQLMASNKPLDQLSPEVRHFRRTSVLASLNNDLFVGSTNTHNPTAILEMMLKYRGLDAHLSPKEQNFYEKTIEIALRGNINGNPTITQDKHLIKLLLASVATQKDYDFVKKMIDSVVLKEKPMNWIRRHIWEQGLHELNYLWEHMHEKSFVLGSFSIQSGVVMNRATLFKDSRFAKTLSAAKPNNGIESAVEPEVEHFEPIAGPSGCQISLRRRRSTSNCLISKSEYDEFVKVIEANGKKILTIDTKEFMEKVDSWQFDNEDKYQELLDIGKKLVDENNARLDGDYAHLFEERVEPRTRQNIAYAEENPTLKIGFNNDYTKQNFELLTHYEPSGVNKLSEPAPSQMHFPEFIHPHPEFSSRRVDLENFKPPTIEHSLHMPIKSFPNIPFHFERLSPILPKIHVPEVSMPVSTVVEMPSILHNFEIPLPKLRIGYRGK